MRCSCQYKLTAIDCLERAIKMVRGINADGNPARLLYAALELRFAIERTVFEYLAIISIDNGISKNIEKLYRSDDLARKLNQIEPDFLKKLQYMNLMFSALDISYELTIPDLDKMNRLYGRLNAYLHAQKKPETTVENNEWWRVLRDTIEQTIDFLANIHGNPIGHIKLNQRGMDVFEKWKSGDISDEAAKDMIATSFHEQSMSQEEKQSPGD